MGNMVGNFHYIYKLDGGGQIFLSIHQLWGNCHLYNYLTPDDIENADEHCENVNQLQQLFL
jgi:hypothetical protein